MYESAWQMVMQKMEVVPTEGVGDCWLISILSDHELPREKTGRLTPKERETFCTNRRKAIVEYASRLNKDGRVLSDVQFDRVCGWCDVPVPVTTSAKRAAKKAVMSVLESFMVERHYGHWQEVMHTVTGWYLGRNILEINRSRYVTRKGISARFASNAFVATDSDAIARSSRTAHSGIQREGAARPEWCTHRGRPAKQRRTSSFRWG